jgi:hypothetical protein
MDYAAKAADLAGKADKRLKAFSLFGSGNKYEEAAELFEKAGNQYKLAKACRWRQRAAAGCYTAAVPLVAPPWLPTRDASCVVAVARYVAHLVTAMPLSDAGAVTLVHHAVCLLPLPGCRERGGGDLHEACRLPHQAGKQARSRLSLGGGSKGVPQI